jgi:iron complex outermembrane receptor protein
MKIRQSAQGRSAHANKMACLFGFGSVLAIIAIGPMQWAFAADAANASDNEDRLQEIVVTAEKRPEYLQDVPKKIDVIDSDQLVNAGVDRIDQLANISVSVTRADESQNTKAPGIRGIASVANSVGVQSQTEIIVDDIPQATFSTLSNELGDVERIEVFAGPQSTLSGRNAAAGVINIVTHSPTDTFQGKMEGTATDDHQEKFTGYVSGPISDTLGFMLSGVYDDWAGPYNNALEDGKQTGGYRVFSTHGKLRWQPAEALTLTATAYYDHTDRTTPPLFGGGAYVRATGNETYNYDALQRPLLVDYPTPITADNHTVFANHMGRAQTSDKGGVFRLDYDLGSPGVFTSLTSYNLSDQPRNDVFVSGAVTTNFTVPSITNFDAQTDVRTNYFTQELRLNSPSTGHLTYTLGGIYTSSDLTEPYYRLEFLPVKWDRTTTIHSLAAFARATWQFDDANSIIGGLRYQDDKIGYGWQFHPLAPGDPSNYSSGSSTYGYPSGEVSLKHNFNNNVNAYFTYSRAQTGEAYDVEDNNDASKGTLKPLPSEIVNNYEVGLKSQLLDRHLVLNASLFDAVYSNYQVQTVAVGCAICVPVIRLFAVGGVVTRGVELAATALPTRALKLSANIAYADAKITSYPGHEELVGNALPYAPKLRGGLQADYTVATQMPFDIGLGALARYQSVSYFDIQNTAELKQNAYTEVNIYASILPRNSKYQVQFFVNNLFNQIYYSQLYQENSFWSAPVASAFYDRDSFRYAGVRLIAKF